MLIPYLIFVLLGEGGCFGQGGTCYPESHECGENEESKTDCNKTNCCKDKRHCCIPTSE